MLHKEPHCVSKAKTWEATQVPSSTVHYRMQNALIAICCLYCMLIHRDEYYSPFNFVRGSLHAANTANTRISFLEYTEENCMFLLLWRLLGHKYALDLGLGERNSDV